MLRKKKVTIVMVVASGLLGIAAGAGQNGSRAEAPPANLGMSSLDYSVQTTTKRLYLLKWRTGPDSFWCKMEVAIDKHKRDASDKNPRADLLDLAISYSDFGFDLQREAVKTAIEGQLREGRLDRFTYAAVIDKYGELVSSDLVRQIVPLRKSPGDAKSISANMLLQPAILCTWLSVFPKLGPFDRGELVGRDIRDWTSFGVPDIEQALGYGATADKFHVIERGGRQVTLWSKVMRQQASVDYLGIDSVSETTKLEISYSADLKGVERASIERVTSFEKQPQNNTSVAFDATLQKQ
jgi:hypothetical protein